MLSLSLPQSLLRWHWAPLISTLKDLTALFTFVLNERLFSSSFGNKALGCWVVVPCSDVPLHSPTLASPCSQLADTSSGQGSHRSMLTGLELYVPPRGLRMHLKSFQAGAGSCPGCLKQGQRNGICLLMGHVDVLLSYAKNQVILQRTC